MFFDDLQRLCTDGTGRTEYGNLFHLLLCYLQFTIWRLKYDVKLGIYGPALMPQLEVKVGTGGQLAGVSYQCDGFTPFHRISFPFQQRAAMLVD